jgi:ribosome assembly protein 1
VESFVFTDRIRHDCQGLAQPQLVFDGFSINDEDPFFIPTKDEEIEDHGLGDILPTNPAKVIIEDVRKRKGLIIDKKIVVAADKQRTLTKNK